MSQSKLFEEQLPGLQDPRFDGATFEKTRDQVRLGAQLKRVYHVLKARQAEWMTIPERFVPARTGGLFLPAGPGHAVLGPIIVRVASFFPFPATYWLNGHSFIEQELKRKQIGFRKNDNASLAVDDATELQRPPTG